MFHWHRAFWRIVWMNPPSNLYTFLVALKPGRNIRAWAWCWFWVSEPTCPFGGHARPCWFVPWRGVESCSLAQATKHAIRQQKLRMPLIWRITGYLESGSHDKLLPSVNFGKRCFPRAETFSSCSFWRWTWGIEKSRSTWRFPKMGISKNGCFVMENPMKILWKSYEHGWFTVPWVPPNLENHQWNAEPRLMRHERTQERLEISSGVGHNLRDPCETRTSGPGAVMGCCH